MWSDPIDNALAAARDILDEVQRGTIKPDATRVSWIIGKLGDAMKAREFEKREGRLLTPEDRL